MTCKRIVPRIDNHGVKYFGACGRPTRTIPDKTLDSKRVYTAKSPKGYMRFICIFPRFEAYDGHCAVCHDAVVNEECNERIAKARKTNALSREDMLVMPGKNSGRGYDKQTRGDQSAW
jgi:hypothetical protein